MWKYNTIMLMNSIRRNYLNCVFYSLIVCIQPVLKMRAVLCGAVVLCLLQCCTAIPVEEFVGYPFNNETHQVFQTTGPQHYSFFVNNSEPFYIAGRAFTRFEASYCIAHTVHVKLHIQYVSTQASYSVQCI